MMASCHMRTSCTNGWNAFKRLNAQASPDERDALLRGTVSAVYRLDEPT